MQLSKVHSIFFVAFLTHSLYGMEQSGSCSTISHLVNIVPEIKAPLAIGCVNKDFIMVQE